MQLKIEISVQSYNDRNSNGTLRVSEDFEIDPVQFTEVAKIIGQFHDLAEKIKRDHRNFNQT